jgi:hypothetical protein
MTRALYIDQLTAIAHNLSALNEIWKDNITAEVMMEWPERFTFTDPDDNDVLGHAEWDMDAEQWTFRPLSDIPTAPPTF